MHLTEKKFTQKPEIASNKPFQCFSSLPLFPFYPGFLL